MAAAPQGDTERATLSSRADSASAKANEADPHKAGPDLLEDAEVARLRAFFEFLDRWDRGEQEGS